jgi:ribosomal protein S18 acetylase RimI-like enzyme
MVLSGLWKKQDNHQDDAKNRLARIVFSHDKNVPPEAIQDLCASVGWARRDPDLIIRALQNSVTVVSAWDDVLLVGFARATGDQVFNATIWDVAVRPNYQGRGIGGLIMKELIKELDSYEISLITLYADHGRDGFYKRFGFASEPYGVRAMFRERL